MKPNTQLRSKIDHREDGSLQVHHVFLTIQGEGPFAGSPSIFVRLFGCNLQCPFCDTDYTSQCFLWTPAQVLHQIIQAIPEKLIKKPLIVITGGEPFRQNITPLTNLLIENGFSVQVETNGTIFLEGFPFHAATVVCSPKTPVINNDLAQRVHAFKYVVAANWSDVDGLPLTTLGGLGSVAKPPANSVAEIFLQPLDEQNQELNLANTQAVVSSCLRFRYRLCIQTHKLLNLE